MTIFHEYALHDAEKAIGVVVVIDVLRAFTTAAYAFNAGVSKIYPVSGVKEALQLRLKMSGSPVMGEVDGEKPWEFDYGNSPDEINRSKIQAKTLIQRTSAGTQGLVNAINADYLFAASFVVAKATAQHICKLEPARVSFIITGESMGRDGDEDRACGEYIRALIRGLSPNVDHFTQRVMDSTAGRSFLIRKNSHTLAMDLNLSLQMNRFSFSMPVFREGEYLVMYPKNLSGDRQVCYN